MHSSPSKKTKLDSFNDASDTQSSLPLSNHGFPGSPLFDFGLDNHSPIPYEAPTSVPVTPLSQIPFSSQVPNSRDWSPSMRTGGALMDFSFPDSMSPAAFQKQHSINGHYNARPHASLAYASGIAHQPGKLDAPFLHSGNNDASMIGEVQQQLIFNRNFLSDRIRSSSSSSNRTGPSKLTTKHDPDAPIDGSDRLASDYSYIAGQSNDDLQLRGSALFPYRDFSVGLLQGEDSYNMNLNMNRMNDYSHNDHSHLPEFSIDDEIDLLRRCSTMESSASSTRSTLIDDTIAVGMDGADPLPDTTMSGLAAITAAAEALPLPVFDPSNAIEYAHSPSRERSNQSMLMPSKRSKALKVPHDSQLWEDEDQRSDSYPDLLDVDIAYSYAANMEKFLSNGGLKQHSSSSVVSSFNHPSSSNSKGVVSYGSPGMTQHVNPPAVVHTEDMQKSVSCNCKKSRCLKMYCDCFRLMVYCQESCNCNQCANLEVKQMERRHAIDAIVERNPEAFKPRVTADPHSNNSKAQYHLTGCHCRKSACLKKYCECYTGGVVCGDRCRCVDCKNNTLMSNSPRGKQNQAPNKTQAVKYPLKPAVVVVLKKDSEVAASMANNRTSLLSNASTHHERDLEYKPSIAAAATAGTSSSSSRWTHNGDSSSTRHESFSPVGGTVAANNHSFASFQDYSMNQEGLPRNGSIGKLDGDAEEEYLVSDNEAAEVLYSVLHSPSMSISRAGASFSAAYREPIASMNSTGRSYSEPITQFLSSPPMTEKTWHSADSASGLSDLKQLLVIDTQGSISAGHANNDNNNNSFHSPGRSNFNSSSSELNLELARSPMQSLLDLASMCERRGAEEQYQGQPTFGSDSQLLKLSYGEKNSDQLL